MSRFQLAKLITVTVGGALECWIKMLQVRRIHSRQVMCTCTRTGTYASCCARYRKVGLNAWNRPSSLRGRGQRSSEVVIKPLHDVVSFLFFKDEDKHWNMCEVFRIIFTHRFVEWLADVVRKLRQEHEEDEPTQSEREDDVSRHLEVVGSVRK